MLIDMMARAQVAVPARRAPATDTVTSVVRSSVTPPPSARDYVMHLAAKKGLFTLASIARAAGLTDSSGLSRWLSGHNGATAQSLRQLADALGAPVRDMVVAFGMFTPEEMGMTQEPPRPPLPEEVETILAILADEDEYTQREHEALLIGLDYTTRGWVQKVHEHRAKPREPKMRDRRAQR